MVGTKTALAGVLIVSGIMIMVGSVTGNLAAMLAALFDPNDLATQKGSKAAPKHSSWVSNVANYASHLFPGGLP